MGSQYVLNESEYRNIDYFSKRGHVKPSERLLRYRRNTIFLSTFVLFFVLSGLEIKGFSGGFISATLDKPDMVFFFLSLSFLYNFYFLSKLVEQEKGMSKLRINSQSAFQSAIARYILQKEISNFMMKHGHIVDPNEYELKSVSQQSKNGDSNLVLSCKLDPDYAVILKENLGDSGLEVKGSQVLVSYSLTDADKAFYSENKGLITQNNAINYLYFEMYKFFGIVTWFFIMYEIFK